MLNCPLVSKDVQVRDKCVGINGEDPGWDTLLESRCNLDGPNGGGDHPQSGWSFGGREGGGNPLEMTVSTELTQQGLAGEGGRGKSPRDDRQHRADPAGPGRGREGSTAGITHRLMTHSTQLVPVCFINAIYCQ